MRLHEFPQVVGRVGTDLIHVHGRLLPGNILWIPHTDTVYLEGQWIKVDIATNKPSHFCDSVDDYLLAGSEDMKHCKCEICKDNN